MADFKSLHVWRKAHALSLNTHRIASGIRGASNVSLRNQMLRAAASIPTNIVEGRAKQGTREFARFLRISLASASELEYHLIVAHDTQALANGDCLSLTAQVVEVRKMLFGLLRALNKSAQAQKHQTE